MLMLTVVIVSTGAGEWGIGGVGQVEAHVGGHG